MTNFYSSGLYTEPFYQQINNLVFDDKYLFNTITYDSDLFLQYYSSKIERKNSSPYIACRQICDLLLLEISTKRLYFQPLIFNPDIALQCGLIPFITQDIKINNNSLYHSTSNKPYIKLLIVSPKADTMEEIDDLFPRLDAYQALTNNSIDKASSLFQDPEYFESVLGKTLTKKVLDAVS
jgi:hypothetical protein